MHLLRIAALGLAAAALLPAASLTKASKPEDVGLSGPRLDRIKVMLGRYIERGEIAGAVSLVARRGRVAHLHAQGMADLAGQKAMREDAIFRIASMTKPIASVALMMLYEEGHFQLTDPVAKFVPEYRDMKVAVENVPLGMKLIPADHPITIRHILTHTAGLANTYAGITRPLHDQWMRERRPDETVGEAMKRLAKLPLNFQPGAAWEYGPATDLVGYLVEVISGMPLDRYLAEKIFQPLGMKDTHFYQPEENLGRMATVYQPKPGGGIQPLALPASSAKKYFSGAGGLSSTIEDYARFCQMLVNGGQFDGKRILSRKTIELMTANHIGELRLWESLPGDGFGLGFSVKKSLGESAQLGSVGTYGWGGAFGTIFFVDPKEEMFGILMLQLRPYNHVNVRQDFRTVVFQSVVD